MDRKIRIAGIVAVLLVIMGGATAAAIIMGGNNAARGERTRMTGDATVGAINKDGLFAVMETSKGAITLELHFDKTPLPFVTSLALPREPSMPRREKSFMTA